MIRNIVTIVVSHNRAELLTRCIESLKKQTYPILKILIVDNGSESDVRELLKSIKSNNKNVDLLLQENLGGAGGFSNGMKYALSTYDTLDILWLMDDDGYPTEDALKELVDSSLLFDRAILNSLVVSDLLTKKLSFPYYDGIDEILKESENIKYIANKANFFNGTFIPKSIVLRLGFPIPKLFVKGDELEYYERALIKLKIPMITVRNSVFVHPSNASDLNEDIPLNKLWHTYFDLRNMFYSHRFNYSFSENKIINNCIRFYQYYKYWLSFRNEILKYQVTNIKLKKKIIFLSLWHNLIRNYTLKPIDINNIISKLKNK